MDVAGLLGATYLGGQVSAPVATSRREGEGRRVETTRPGRLQSHQGARHRRREARAPAGGAVREVVDGRKSRHVFIVRRVRVVVRATARQAESRRKRIVKAAPSVLNSFGEGYAGTQARLPTQERVLKLNRLVAVSDSQYSQTHHQCSSSREATTCYERWTRGNEIMMKRSQSHARKDVQETTKKSKTRKSRPASQQENSSN